MMIYTNREYRLKLHSLEHYSKNLICYQLFEILPYTSFKMTRVKYTIHDLDTSFPDLDTFPFS